MRFLVVDDEPTARTMLSLLLGELGDIDEAVDGDEALVHFVRALQNRLPYDLICIDLSMPGIDGLELIEQLREFERAHGYEYRSRMVVVSASRAGEDIVSAFRNQADGYLTKPINIGKLEKLLRDFSITKKLSA